MAEWIECSIGDLCSTISDTYKGNDEYVVLVNTSDVLEGKVLNHETVANKNLKGQFKKTFKRDDILYSEIRPANKRFAYIDFENTSNYIASTKLMVLRHNEKVLPEYLFALLKSNYVIAELQHLAETRSGTFPQITFSSELAPMKVFLPDKDTQIRIVSILSSIEQKIDKNNEINNNLEQQAQAIFKSWFVDFEHFGGIQPPEMKFVPLQELCKVVTKGTTPTTIGKAFTSSGIKFIKAESILDNHSFDSSKFAFIDEETNALLKRSVIKANDIVFTIAGTLGRFAMVDNSVLPANTNQAVAIIRPDDDKVTPAYLYSFFIGNWHNEYYSKRIQQAVQANLSLTTIKSLPIAVLSNATMNKYDELVKPLFALMKSNEEENHRLSELRDTLLPRLMSGELDVSNIDL